MAFVWKSNKHNKMRTILKKAMQSFLYFPILKIYKKKEFGLQCQTSLRLKDLVKAVWGSVYCYTHILDKTSILVGIDKKPELNLREAITKLDSETVPKYSWQNSRNLSWTFL